MDLSWPSVSAVVFKFAAVLGCQGKDDFPHTFASLCIFQNMVKLVYAENNHSAKHNYSMQPFHEIVSRIVIISCSLNIIHISEQKESF